MIFSRWGKQLAEINGYNNDDKAWLKIIYLIYTNVITFIFKNYI